MGLEQGHGLLGEVANILAHERGRAVEEILGEQGDVLPPLRQGRQVEVDDVETKPEVLTEAPVSDPDLEIAVAGGEEAYLHPQGADAAQIQRQFNVVLAKTVLELNGIPCLALEEAPPPRQQIITSRSFGRPERTFQMLSEAVASHTARAAAKLRQEGLQAGLIQVFAGTNPFK
jgi:hypothetical protein